MKFFNLAFIGAFGGPHLQSRHLQKSSTQFWATSPSTVVNFNVGGIKYSLFDEDIRKHPGSFFEKFLKNQDQKEQEVTVERDGELFKFVHAFMVTGQLPRTAEGSVVLSDNELARIDGEADFYGLQTLRHEISKTEQERNINLFTCNRTKAIIDQCKNLQTEYPVEVQRSDSPLFGELKRIIAPLCSVGGMRWPDMGHQYGQEHNDVIAQTSRVDELQTEKLIEMAKQIKGRNAESNHTFILDTLWLNTIRLEELGDEIKLLRMFPHTKVQLVPTKLVIQTAGSDYQLTNSKRNETHLGTLVVVCNSAFDGGQVSVETAPLATTFELGAMQWLAVHPNCSFTTSPVTSGTRVTIEYDMYTLNEPNYFDDPNRCPNYPYDKYHTIGMEPSPFDISTLVDTQTTPVDVQKRTVQAIDAELQEQDALLIGLQHLYPDFDRDGPSSLKGGDRALYELLSPQFDVSMVATTIRINGRDSSNYYDQPPEAPAGLHFPAGSVVDARITAESKSKLFLPLRLTKEHVLDESRCGWDSDTFYIVSALYIMKKG